MMSGSADADFIVSKKRKTKVFDLHGTPPLINLLITFLCGMFLTKTSVSLWCIFISFSGPKPHQNIVKIQINVSYQFILELFRVSLWLSEKVQTCQFCFLNNGHAYFLFPNESINLNDYLITQTLTSKSNLHRKNPRQPRSCWNLQLNTTII